jgi:hypothetical protein
LSSPCPIIDFTVSTRCLVAIIAAKEHVGPLQVLGIAQVAAGEVLLMSDKLVLIQVVRTAKELGPMKIRYKDQPWLGATPVTAMADIEETCLVAIATGDVLAADGGVLKRR